MTTTTYGSSATFTCESLYDMSGNNVLTCNADGVWSSAPPTCIDIGMLLIVLPHHMSRLVENQQCGFRTGPTQTGLYKRRKELEA